MGLAHGIFFAGGQAFVNPDTILPVFLNHFTQSKALIGLAGAIISGFGGVGNALPQLFVAHRIENKLRKLPILRAAITVRGLSWGLLALSTFLLGTSQPTLTVFFLFFFLILFTLMGGVAVVPFYDIWAKALPSTMRGKFFGYRQFGGGLLAIGSGYLAKIILGHQEITFPNNFVLLFLLAFVLMSISFLALGSVKEPLEEVHETRIPFNDFLKKSLRILKNDGNYRALVYVQILSGTGALALPFYVLYAREMLKIELEMVGLFVLAQMAGKVLSNLVWAHVSDKYGNKIVIQISSLLGVFIPLIAILTPKDLPELFIILFALMGVFISGRGIGKTNFLLDLAPAKERPSYISLNGALSLIVMVMPLAGGFFLHFISFQFLFALTLLTMFLGFLMSLKLQCIRTGK